VTRLSTLKPVEIFDDAFLSKVITHLSAFNAANACFRDSLGKSGQVEHVSDATFGFSSVNTGFADFDRDMKQACNFFQRQVQWDAGRNDNHLHILDHLIFGRIACDGPTVKQFNV
jgi:hypothetical protein